MKHETKKILVAIIILTAAAALSAVGYNALRVPRPESIITPAARPVKENSNVYFITDGYFFDSAVTVTLGGGENCEIYYTMDGKPPETDGILYKDGILLEPDESKSVRVYSVKAAAKSKNGVWSKEAVHSFFVGADIENRFDMLVFSLNVDPGELYGENGIFKKYEQRGDGAERGVYVELIDESGSLLLSQNAGIRVHGQGSRRANVKSLRLYARSEYDEKSWFDYPVFPDAVSCDGVKITSYKRLLLRTSGNDYNRAFIRDALAQRLSAEAGFFDTENVRPCVVFLNGVYQTVYWLQEFYSDPYFENTYGAFTGTFEILDGRERERKDTIKKENPVLFNEYEEFYALSSLDLTNDDNYALVSARLDVPQYLFFYAINTLLDNEDWPQNNSLAYKYYPAEGEEYGDAPFDGKWRFMMHDMDFLLGINGNHVNRNCLECVLNEDYVVHHSSGIDLPSYSPMFGALMKRTELRKYFVRKMTELMNGVFTAENMNKTVDEMAAEQRSELERFYAESAFKSGSIRTYESNFATVKRYITTLVPSMKKQLAAIWGYEKMYTLNTISAGNSGIMMDEYKRYGKYTGSYYTELDTLITPLIAAGEEFSHWTVNGERVNDRELRLDGIKEGENVVVRLFLSDEPENKRLVIREISSCGEDDYIVLYNPYNTTVSTLGYSISDRGDEKKSSLPAIYVAPHTDFKILCDNYTSFSALHKIATSFSLKAGETLSLFYKGELLESVKIPKIKPHHVYTRNLVTGEFYETGSVSGEQ